MTANDLARLITAREGKKKQISVAQAKEVLGVMADLTFADPAGIYAILLGLGKRRATSRVKTCRKPCMRVETSLHKRVKGRK